MALHPAFGPHAAGTTALDGRLAFAGLLVQSAAGGARPGILSGGATLVTLRADRFVDVAPFTAALTRGAADGASFIANDGSTPVAIAPAPAANSRYDVIFVRQRDSITAQAPDGDNLPVFGVSSSDASPQPSLAAAVARMPRGALPLASLLVPASATTTNGMTVAQIAPFAAPKGSPVEFRTVDDLNADTALPVGTEALVLATTGRWVLGRVSTGTKQWARRGRNLVSRGMDNAGGAIVQPNKLSSIFCETRFEAPVAGDLHAHVQVWIRGTTTGAVLAGSIFLYVDGTQLSADGARGRIHNHGANGPQTFDADLTTPLTPGSHLLQIRIGSDAAPATDLEFWEVTWNYAIHY